MLENDKYKITRAYLFSGLSRYVGANETALDLFAFSHFNGDLHLPKQLSDKFTVFDIHGKFENVKNVRSTKKKRNRII